MSNVAELPRIAISAGDHERLQNIADAAARTAPRVAEYLQYELDRATICDAQPDGPAKVEMGSYVEFRDDKTGRVRSVQLVYPAQADPAAGKISVLTPIGAALIGLSEKQSIEWPTRTGERKTLTVLKVFGEPGAFGYLDM